MVSRIASPLLIIATLGACNRPPMGDADAGEDDGCEVLPPTSTNCGDSLAQPGELCLAFSQSFEVEPPPLEMPAELLVADFNGNGHSDLRAERLNVFGDGQGGFETSSPMGAGAVNAVIEVDGLLGDDVIWGTSIARNEADPENPVAGYAGLRFFAGGPAFPSLVDETILFETESIDFDWELADFAVGDFDGDGDDDVAASMVLINYDIRTKQLWLLTNLGNFEFDRTKVAERPTGFGAPREFVAAGRLGSDPTDDVIWDGTMFEGGPEGLSEVGVVPVDESADQGNGRWLFRADITCDGIPDLVTGDATGAVILAGLSADPYYDSGLQTTPLGDAGVTGWVPWDVGDLNGDDVPDLVFTGDGQTMIVSAGSAWPVITPHQWVAARAVDLNGDGRIDLAGTFVDSAGPTSGIDLLLATP